MKSVNRRIGKLEESFGVSKKGRLLVIVSLSSLRLALDEDRCIQILDECGFLQRSGIAMAFLSRIPDELNASETEKFLRTEGAKICGPRRS